MRRTSVHQKLAPKESECSLQVFMDKKEVARPYDVVCELRSNTGTFIFDPRTLDQAVKAAHREACRCGGDAMFVESFKKKWMTFSRAIVAEIKVIKYK